MKQYNTKLFSLLAFILLFETNAVAQDVIILIDGNEIKSHVDELFPEYIKYRIFNDQSGQIYSKAIAEICKIQYANGSEDLFNEMKLSESAKTPKKEPTENVAVSGNDYTGNPKKESVSAPVTKSYYTTTLTVTNIYNTAVMQKIETGVSALLTEFNKAFFENRKPSLNKIGGLSKEAKSDIYAMWETNPFRCIETEMNERGLHTPSGGFQVRNIPIYLKDMPDEDAYNEIAINFDNMGNIEGIYYTLELNQYQAIMYDRGNDVTDYRRRQAILNFIENFRTAYNRKDIGLIGKMYSEDALIITGKVVKTRTAENILGQSGFSTEIIDYQVQTKKEYINKLSGIFNRNPKIDIVFDNLELMQHPKYDNIYGVTLKQKWNTSTYDDVGWLFLLIDFSDGENMIIHVRTWQPEIGPGGKPLKEEDIFQPGDFIIGN